MELFRPCRVQCNQEYFCQVQMLTREELRHLNSVMLDMETEEFAFHELDRIRDSMMYYDNHAVFADKMIQELAE